MNPAHGSGRICSSPFYYKTNSRILIPPKEVGGLFKSVLFITKEVTELPSKQAGLEVSGPLPLAGFQLLVQRASELL
jgi:hypothetical protein